MEHLQRRFATADPRYGPVPWWWWSAEEVTAERIQWQLKKFRDGGLRNIGIIHLAPRGPAFHSVSDRPAYMSEEWWKLFEVALREAERLDMYLWFYDQIGFGGANLTAHLVAKFPHFAGYHLARFAPAEPLPNLAEVLLETEDFVYVAVRQGFNWLDEDAAAKLIDRVHGEFERRFPHDLGRTIAGSFQDELPPLPVWTPELPKRYRERHGEELPPRLPALFEPVPGAEEVRRRVYRLAAELAEDVFFKPLGQWHERYGMQIAFDQAGPARRADPHAAQRFYLDYFRTHRWFNTPGNDMDGETKPHSSMAHLHGGRRVWLEAFHSSGWGGSLEETMHWLLPWLLDGATQYAPHAVYYSTRGGWWEWAPPDTGWRQPYFEQYAPFADTVSRICYLLDQGHHVCDVGVHYPSYATSGHISLSHVEQGEHPMRAANRDPDEQVSHIRNIYWGLTGFRNRRSQQQIGALREHGQDFDIVDDLALANARPDGKKLRIADESFSVLLLCGTTVMSDEARQTLERWIIDGGQVIAVDVRETEPCLTGAVQVSSPSEAARRIAQTVPPRVEGPGESLQRRVDGADVFLLTPPRDSLLPMHAPATGDFSTPEPARYRLRTKGRPQLWNPVTGSVRELPHEQEGEMVTVAVPFDDWPAALVVCVEEDNAPSATRNGRPSQEVPRRSHGRESDTLTEGPWRVRIDSTLDNRYGDFDLHGEERGFLPIERRHMRVRREDEASAGVAAGWHMPSHDDADWKSYLWSESAYWLAGRGDAFNPETARPVVYSNTFGDLAERTWMGRMGRVHRRFLNLGTAEPGEVLWARTYVLAPADGVYFLHVESDHVFQGQVNGQDIVWNEMADRQVARVMLGSGSNELFLTVQPEEEKEVRAAVDVSPVYRPPLPSWAYTRTPTPASFLSSVVESDPRDPARQVRLNFAAKGRAALFINGQKVTEHGDFHPISRYGQEEIDISDLWQRGANEVRVELPEGAGEVLVDGIVETDSGKTLKFSTNPGWRDERGEPAGVVFGAEGLFVFGSDRDTLCIWERPHPLPDVGWLTPDAVPSPSPLPFMLDPTHAGQPVWLRFPLPAGATAMNLQLAGPAQLWIDGMEVEVRKGRALFSPQPPGTLAAIRVEPEGPATDAAVLLAPIRFDTAPATAPLGDWRDALALPHFSGAVEYETLFESENWSDAILELGHVRGTAEVWVDGKALGVRIWRPYRFALGDLEAGRHRLRIRVTNTLGAHYEIGRPTSMVGAHPGFFPEAAEAAKGWPALHASGGLFGPVAISHEG